MANIGNLAVMITANTQPLMQGLGQSAGAVKQFAGQATVDGQTAGRSLGEAIATGMKSASSSVVTFGNSLKDISGAGAIRSVTDSLSGLVTKAGELATAGPAAAGGLASMLNPLTAIAAAAAAAVAGLASLTVSVMHGALETFHLAERLGTSVAGLKALQFQAQLTGIEAETLTRSLSILQRNIGQATEGNQKAARSFTALGLDAVQLAHMPVDEAFAKIAERIAAIPEASGRAAAAFHLLGKQGQQLVPMLAEGAEGLDKARARLQQLAGTKLDHEQVKEFNASIVVLEKSFSGLKVTLAAALAPTVKAIADGLSHLVVAIRPIVAGIGSVLGAISSVVGTLVDFVANCVAVKLILSALGGTLSVVGGALGAVFGFLKEIGTYISVGFNTVIGLLVQAFAKLFDLLGSLPSWLGGDWFEQQARGARQLASDITDANRALLGMGQVNHGNNLQAQLDAVQTEVENSLGMNGPQIDLSSVQSARHTSVARAVYQSERGPATDNAAATLQADLDKINEGLQRQIATMGMSAAEVQQYDLALRGASEAQLEALRTRQQLAKQASDEKSVADMQAKLRDQIGTMGMTARQADLWRLSQRGINDEMTRTVRAQMEILDYMERQNAAKKSAQAIIDSTRTPLDNFYDQMAELDNQLAAGRISQETHALAAAREFNRLAGASQQQVGPKSVEEGSAEALSAIHRFQQGDRQIDQMERVNRVLEAQRLLQQRHLEQAQQINQALQQINIADFV